MPDRFCITHSTHNQTEHSTMNNATINALNQICDGWSESTPGGMLVNPAAAGGIIDDSPAIGEWFVIFNDDRKSIVGFDSRDDAVEAFAAASRTRI